MEILFVDAKLNQTLVTLESNQQWKIDGFLFPRHVKFIGTLNDMIKELNHL